MNTPSPDIVDSQGIKIVPGSVVRVVFENFIFGNAQGLVIDTYSDMKPENGPIAVFFDSEVPDYRFDARWSQIHYGGEILSWEKRRIPTPEDYKTCFRVLCFHHHELCVDKKFTRENIADRLFGRYWALNSWKFELVPNAHLCQLKDCLSGHMATCESFVNVCGSVYVIYTCANCHKKVHGMCCDDFQLKDPLPGKPQVEEPVLA